MIYIDSRRCGEGKTFDGLPNAKTYRGFVLATWARIKQHYKWDDYCLVVLPSIKLCNYYRDGETVDVTNTTTGKVEQRVTVGLREWILEQSSHKFDSITDERQRTETLNRNLGNQLAVLHSQVIGEDGKPINVQAELHKAIEQKCSVIIITQETFKNCDIDSLNRQYYHLIIDEAIEPYREQTIYHDKNCKVDFDLSNNLAIMEAPDTAVAWKQIQFDDIKGNALIDSGDLVTDLTHKNWRNRCLHTDSEKLLGIVPKTKAITIIQELRAEIMEHWASIWVACAAFEVTFMRYWLDRNKIAWRIHPQLEFVRHTTEVIVNGSDELIWSKHKKNNLPNIYSEFGVYAGNIIKNEPTLRLSNNGSPKLFENEVTMTHNIAGMNSYTDIKHISLESALNPSPTMSKFLLDAHEEQFDGQTGDLIYQARTLYLYYQAAMRSCLRNDEPANIHILDKRALRGFDTFFANMNLGEEYKFTLPEKKKVGRKPTNESGIAMTSAERQRKRRALLKEQSNA